LSNSNKLAVRVLPCDVVARVAHIGREVAALEVELACRLSAVGAPAGALDPRVQPGGYKRDGFSGPLWADPRPAGPPVVDYAEALARLHAGMRTIDVATPHFEDRVAEAEHLVTTPELTPDLADADRELLATTLTRLRDAIRVRGAAEQLLHGEPH